MIQHVISVVYKELCTSRFPLHLLSNAFGLATSISFNVLKPVNIVMSVNART